MSIRPLQFRLQEDFQLFLVSFLILYFELAFIRWIAAYVPFVTFFSNFVLIGSFVGMSIGCLSVRSSCTLKNHIPHLLCLVIGTVIAIHYIVLSGNIHVSVANTNSPERVFFGAEWGHQNLTQLAVPVEVLLGLIYALIVLLFIGLGQRLGELLDGLTNHLKAYTINIAGSLAGIVVFALISYLSLSPIWWFLLGLVGLFLLMPNTTKQQLVLFFICAGLVLAGIIWLDKSNRAVKSIWTPYYHLEYSPSKGQLTVNGLGHQAIRNRKFNLAYSVTYLLAQTAGAPQIKNVLIIGAGTGNDAAHALWNGASAVDAVEIDPRFLKIGEHDHPNYPYQDARVTRYVDDGRSFLENTDKKYDLIAYGLVDSLTLHSSYTSVRLENFLYTEEAFEAVKRRLNPNGIFAIYNYYRQPWIVIRMYQTLAKVFGEYPIAISLPAKEVITPDDPTDNRMSLLLAGNTKLIRQAFEKYGYFQLNPTVFLNTPEESLMKHPNGFLSEGKKAVNLLYIVTPSTIQMSSEVKNTTDNWPFLYLKDPRIPKHNLIGMLIITVLSGVFYLFFRPQGAKGLNFHFFCLGASFMLIETINLTRLSVLFGSTWVVSSIVFSAVLVMILLGNFFVLHYKPGSLKPYYAALFAALLANILVETHFFLQLTWGVRVLVSSLFVFLPIFFASIIFAVSFAKSKNPHRDFGSNIAGVVLGALLENLSLAVGYHALSVLVILFYILSMTALKKNCFSGQ